MKKTTILILSLLLSLQLTACSNTNNDVQKPYRFGNIISYNANQTALEYLKSTDKVEVEDSKYIVFTPKENIKETGFIFYPGGLVEAESYAPIMNKIAQQGYQVIIVPMPINLAVLNSDKAKNVIKEYPNINNWIIGGHSLGGVMACKYAAKHDNIKGIVLYASYPEDDQLKNTDVKVLSLWGSEDKIASIDKILDGKNKLNSSAEFIEIEGGNHGHFGDYGEQKGDGQSTITFKKQWDEAAKYTTDFLGTFN
ncbi:MAG: alpha/beta hydrolase [Clostridium butyricum]|nr:alpha/beta hydrolase [Clostridium butyricum]